MDHEFGVSKDYRGFQCGVKTRAIDDEGPEASHEEMLLKSNVASSVETGENGDNTCLLVFILLHGC